jgi:phosphonate metabolism transcriptional regulator PhnF
MHLQTETRGAGQARRPLLWHSIAKQLEADIAERRLAAGDKLPTEQQLCDQFKTNRHTVRRALAHLQARGLVESTQGRGSFVRKPSILYQIGRRTRFSDLLQQQAANPSTRTLMLELRPAGPQVAAALGIRAGAPAIFVERMGYANDQPISIACHWFSSERLPGFRGHYNRSQSITQTLADCGVPDYTRLRTRISARLPTPAEAELLNLPRHIPLLTTRSWNIDGEGRPMEYGEARMAADRTEVLIETETRLATH